MDGSLTSSADVCSSSQVATAAGHACGEVARTTAFDGEIWSAAACAREGCLCARGKIEARTSQLPLELRPQRLAQVMVLSFLMVGLIQMLRVMVS
ncbi:hypothetical protein PR202_gb29607 [Eleusine coracana subsp. coracana]|uniref:Uncharacterized protein n=1 Tax=Eleusine coracana subsp. coracana TaxID=191504 RepID=A0AAV5G0G4_ELECO|nr:hypothetical protein PR202_gb29607 [Eleusine coracana subsp. coracana]